MTNFDFSPFKGLYLTTAREYVLKLKKNTETLLNQPDNTDAIDTIYISSHSLGSQSTLTGFKNMESICGIIEGIFLKIKKDKIKVSQDLLTALKDSIVGLTNCLDSIDKKNKEIDLSGFKNRLELV